MATKKNNFINEELDWSEIQLQTWRKYIDEHPVHLLTDRIEWKTTKTGGAMPMVIASIEAQGKFIQETLKNYLSLLEVVNRLREKEEAKVSVKGGSDIPIRMQ